MIVGETARFAMEFQVDANAGGEWLLGKFCYWIAGVRVGDWDRGTSLRDVLLGLDEIAKGRNKRCNARFDGVSAEEVFRVLDDALFGESSAEPEPHVYEEEWGFHVFAPNVDVFDAWKVYLVESRAEGRLVVARAPCEVIGEEVLRAGECDEVLGRVRKAMEEVYQDIVGRDL
jgi:hypothetical protein